MPDLNRSYPAQDLPVWLWFYLPFGLNITADYYSHVHER
jgi:hypothetical protein